MIEVRKQENLYHHQRSWLKTDWHFSFGEYRDPENDRFGPLTVVNNDYIDAGGGFPTHSHDNMEIITWVIEGTLAHEDSTGASETIPTHGVQTMSAGTGISHSEYNPSEEDSLHLLQIWVEPDQRDVEPRYEDRVYGEDELIGDWIPIASGRDNGAGTRIYQDASLCVRHAPDSESFFYELDPERRAYLIQIAGKVSVNDGVLDPGDGARIQGESELEFGAEAATKLMLIDLP